MDPAFWHRRWANGELGFHEGRPNALLAAHFERIGPAPGSRVFVPLCGKARDVGWLLERGHRVIGVELSERAVAALFDDLGVRPDVRAHAAGLRYSAPGIEVFAADLFDLDAEDAGPVDATYDRAALVALPGDVRARYAARVTALTAGAAQVVITFEYDQRRMEGPPFSLNATDIERYYGGDYRVERIECRDVPGLLKGRVEATETLWRLTPAGGGAREPARA